MKKVNKIDLDLLGLKVENKVLDIGCSFGEQAMEIAKQGLVVYGIDLSFELIKKFRNRAREKKLQCFPIVGDATKMPYKSNQFDAIIATEVFEHIPDVKGAIKESFRVLSFGGRACISVPSKITEQIFMTIHPFWVQDSTHVHLFSQKRIISLLEEVGFKIERVEKLNFEWTLFWLIHSIFKTQFDQTGSPVQNHHISEKYAKVLNYLFRIRVGKYLIWFGNQFLPKSYYIYALKEQRYKNT